MLFIGANVAAQLIGIATVIFLTYFLTPGQFGVYAIALFIASMLTIVINAGSLQGTLMTVFGAADEDDSGDDDDSLLITDAGFDRRRFLTSSVICTSMLALLIVGLTTLFAQPLARLAFGARGSSELIVLAALSGATGAMWRLPVNILRLERRVAAYCIFRLLRPIGAFVAIVLLESMGLGLEGALIGLAAGSIISLIPTLFVSHHSYRLAFHPADFARAMRRGLPYVPITICAGFVHTAGVYLLAGYRGAAEVGRFSVASSMSSANAQYVSGFLTSYSPVRRTSAFAAAEHHDAQRFHHSLINLFTVTALLVFLAIALLADELIRVSPKGYERAAAIVPYALVGWTAFGFYMLIYRVSTLPRKRLIYVCVSVASAGIYIGLSAILDRALGARGQGLAMGLTYAATGTVVLAFSQLGKEPLPMDFERILAAVLLATGCYFAFRRLSNAFPELRLAIELAGIAVYAAGILAWRVLPREAVRPLVRALRGALPRVGILAVVDREIAELEGSQSRVLRSLGRPRSPAELAHRLDMTESELKMRAVAALRTLSGLGGPRACDVRIGSYLLSNKSVSERDVLARQLWTELNPTELDRLESTLRLVRRAVRRAQRRSMVNVRLNRTHRAERTERMELPTASLYPHG